jgi:PhnB protein
MTSKVKPIPDGYHAATPYLCVSDAVRAIDFYKKAFGATETMRMAMPDGRIGHAEIKINDASIMLADECPEMEFRSPQSLGGSPVTIHLYVEDVDALTNRSVAAGAKVLRPVEDQFYGDRAGKLADPFGHVWYVATHKEDVSPEEIQRRSEEMFSAKAAL